MAQRPRSSRRVGRYRSPLDAAVAADLDERGVSFEYETVEIYYEVARMYVPDFVLPNGIVIEAKGWFPAEDRRKMLEVKRANPDLDIRIVFEKAQKKISSRAGALTYAGWCDRHGFKWAEAYVPVAWTQERGQ